LSQVFDSLRCLAMSLTPGLADVDRDRARG
jgi:hypothetical protein